MKIYVLVVVANRKKKVTFSTNGIDSCVTCFKKAFYDMVEADDKLRVELKNGELLFEIFDQLLNEYIELEPDEDITTGQRIQVTLSKMVSYQCEKQDLPTEVNTTNMIVLGANEEINLENVISENLPCNESLINFNDNAMDIQVDDTSMTIKVC